VSFILDALRKSEHERQRSAVPSLAHVPLAAPRREMPRWTLLVIGVLATAVLVLGAAWWQSQRAQVASSPAAAAGGPIATKVPPTATPAIAPPSDPSRTPPAIDTAPAQELAAAVPASSPRSPEPSAAANEESQSLAQAAIVPRQPPRTGPTLPSVAALQAQGISVPTLKLELHAYSDRPSERFVFINGRKYKEGERLTEGPEVVAVEPNGVVLSQQGQRFLLAPE
jgi:general secretion pathway protein B